MNAQELQFILKDRWRGVPGFEGLYEVSSAGFIRSLGFQTSTGYRKGRVLKASLTSAGYPAVSLMKDGKKSTVRVHRAVCEAFHGPAPSPKHEVAHNDGVRAHSWASNLRWDTRKGNQADKVQHGTALRGDKHHKTVIPDSLVQLIAQEYIRGSSTHGLKALAKKYGVSIQPIHSIVRGERLVAGGAL